MCPKSDPTADRNRSAIDERDDENSSDRHDLHTAEGHLVTGKIERAIVGSNRAARHDVEKDSERNSDRRRTTTAGNEKSHPPIQKAPEPPIGLADENVFAPSPRHHRSQFGIDETTR